MSQYLAPVESDRQFTGSTLNRRPIFAAALGALLGTLLSAPVHADGTDLSPDEVYSDGVTLLEFDGTPLDINGDGNVDVAIATNQSGNNTRSRYYLGNGDGTFEAVGVQLGAPVTDNGPSSEIAVGDLNGDMILDLIQGRRDLTNRQYFGDGTGLGAGADVSADTNRTLSVSIGDLDNDMDLDVVTGNGKMGGVVMNPAQPNRFCLNDSMAGFTCSDISGDLDDTRGIALADMDNDGDLDVIAGNDETTAGSNRVYANQFIESGMTAVSFAAGVDFGDANDQTSKVLIGDLDNDGLPDVVTLNNISTVAPAGVNGANRFFLNQNTIPGTLALGGAMDVSADADRTSGGALADFDGDGDLDLAVANLLAQGGSEVSQNRLYLNQFIETGTVSFAAGLDISADAHQSRELAAADLDDDGDVDIVVGNQNNVPAGVKDRVYLNSGNPVNPFGNDPFFTSTPVTTATEGAPYTYVITTSDPDAGDALTITAPTLPAWLTLTDNGDRTATLTGTPAAGDVGPNDVVLEVTDGTTTAMQSFMIDVAPAGAGNTAPAFTSVPVLAAVEGTVYTYAITTFDPDVGDMLTITAPTLPTWLTLTDNTDGTATLTGTPTVADVGMPNNVALEVSDGTAVGTQTFSIVVAPGAPGNAAPTFTSTAVTDATVGMAYSYAITTEDADGDPVTISEAMPLPSWLAVTDNGDGTATLAGTPAAVNEGDNPVSLQVSDGTDMTMQDFTITVAAVPGGDTTPPVITLIGPAVVNVTINSVYNDMGATAMDDVDGDITDQIVETSNVDTSAVGTYMVTFNVSDAAGNAATPVTRQVMVSVPRGDNGGGGSLGVLSLLAMLGFFGTRRLTRVR